MSRICTRCGRPLDAEGHRIEQVEVKRPSGLVVKDDARITEVCRRGRGRVRLRRQRAYECRVRLIARSPISGDVIPATMPQRIKELDQAYVHESRLQPGGDLHD